MADQVFLDDLIVDGSACIGMDCASGENFGFDTLRLKENNLRLDFTDTSGTGSFPSNDWAIIANDSDNGGENYLAFEDSDAGRQPFRVEAGAGNNALVVADNGQVGMGTRSPVLELHIVDGDSPGVRIEQDGSSGWTPQTWDVSGNETNFFVRDVTNGSLLPFKIRPSAPTNTLYVDSNGEIGLGTSNPAASLDVASNGASGAPDIRVSSSAPTGAPGIDVVATGANGAPNISVTYDNTTKEKRNLLTLTNYGNPQISMVNTNNANSWIMGAGNGFVIEHTTSGTRVADWDTTGNLVIPGSITTGGGTCGGGCDLVFTEDYDLPTIAEHTEAMWENGFLPNVGPTIENEPFNVSDKVGRMLNELETAHIYIAELHGRLEAVESELAARD